MFVGRTKELEQLQALKKKRAASLVVIRGRRRIGKSSLARTFGGREKEYYEFQGLAPREGIGLRQQLDNFAEQIKQQFGGPSVKLRSWPEAFELLANYTKKGRVIILLDEISWMSSSEPDFAGKLKIAWDTAFSRNNELILILCGSVSSWIEKNILKATGFVGRISLQIDLKELPLPECAKFWASNSAKISNREKLSILSLTGGVPKYLEEFDFKQSIEGNIKRLFFSPSGFFFNEFEHIFSDIFGKRSSIYRKIVEKLKNRRLSPKELAKALDMPQNGDFTDYMNELELSGFVARDYAWNFDGTASKISTYRISDNYLRLYINYLEPLRKKIKDGAFSVTSLNQIPQWDSISGLQFENLVLQNRLLIAKHIGISPEEVQNSGSFRQTSRTSRQGCQIDLLIQTLHRTLFVCEIKFKNIIKNAIVKDLDRKLKALQAPKRFSLRPVLIYEGELEDEDFLKQHFDCLLPFSKLLEAA